MGERIDAKEYRYTAFLQFIKEWVPVFLPIIAVWILVSKIIMLTHVSSGSMEPALMTGDIAVHKRISVKNEELARGEIVVFWFEEYQEYFGKRVIGLPTETISFYEGDVYINNQRLDESEYIDGSIQTICNKTFTVPPDSYFLLGDNRENSNDSRFWSNPYIKREDVKGIFLFSIPLHHATKGGGGME